MDKEHSVAIIPSAAATSLEQTEREDKSTRARQRRQSQALLMETRQQNDHCLENAAAHQDTTIIGFASIASRPSSMSHLVINNDVLTGSTEVHLTPSSSTTTPPTSPIARKSSVRTPESPSLGDSIHSSSSSSSCNNNATKSCQKRGRFLVWPVAAPPCVSTTSTAAS